MKTEILLEIDGDIEGDDITELTLKAAFMDDLSYARFPDESDFDEYWTIEESTKAKSIDDFVNALKNDNEFMNLLSKYSRNNYNSLTIPFFAEKYLLKKYGWKFSYIIEDQLSIFDSMLEKNYNKIINGGNDNEN